MLFFSTAKYIIYRKFMSAICHKIGASVKKADAPEALLNMNCLRTEDKVIAFAVSGSSLSFT